MCATVIFAMVLAQSPTVARWSIVPASTAQLADAVTTLQVAGWEGREVNPLVPTHRTAFVMTKAAAGGLNALLAWKAAKKHPRLVFWLQTGLTVGMTYVAVRNARVQ